MLNHQRERYAGKRTLVVGAGHSAANVLLSLAELAQSAPGTQLVWAVRSPTLARVFGGGEADALPARGQLGAALKTLRDNGGLQFISGLRVGEVRRDGAAGITVRGLDGDGRPLTVTGIDQIVCATGQRPDLGITSELRLALDAGLESAAALGPLIDPRSSCCA